MPHYMQKWVSVEAIQYTKENRAEVCKFVGTNQADELYPDEWLFSPPVYFNRRNGQTWQVRVGDYVVKDIPSGDLITWAGDLFSDFIDRYTAVDKEVENV